MEMPILTPTDFIAITNQTLEYAFGMAIIEGELANFRISKNKWVYFDIKDETAKVSCFGTVYALPGPLEDGMIVRISGSPRLHPQFGFSVTVQSIQPSGEGAIKKAFDLLRTKLEQEGLFDVSRKRLLPHPPKKIALLTSTESAAYADFMKITSDRWPFVQIYMYDVQVQGDAACVQIVSAINAANADGDVADVLVVTRGGGSADDLAVFNDERVVRAIASSRIPTFVAIGHEVDESLAELAADRRASTPSNAAELLVPDRKSERRVLVQVDTALKSAIKSVVINQRQDLVLRRKAMKYKLRMLVDDLSRDIQSTRSILQAYNPHNVLKRGYALVRSGRQYLSHTSDFAIGDSINIELDKVELSAKITRVTNKESL